MSIFRYQAIDGHGKRRRGEVRADSRRHAHRQLKEQDYYVVVLHEEDAEARRSTSALRASRGALTDFTRELAVLLRGALSVDEALEACRETAPDATWRQVLGAVREQVRGGAALSTALAGQALFPEMYCRLVAVGEGNGTLPQVLGRLADTLEQQETFRRKLLGALTYPLFLSVLGLGVGLFLFLSLLPTVENLFASYGGRLPAPTRLLVSLHHFLAGGGWLIVFGSLLACLFGIIFIYRFHRPTWDRMILRAPVLGALQAEGLTADLARTLTTLLQSGTPLVESLETARAALGNAYLRERLGEAVARLQEGRGPGEALGEINELTPIFRRLVAMGERSGNPGEILEPLAEFLERRVLDRWELVARFIEPALIVLIGIGVGFAAVALFLPLVEMSGAF
jgi:general secretion pathway protein F